MWNADVERLHAFGKLRRLPQPACQCIGPHEASCIVELKDLCRYTDASGAKGWRPSLNLPAILFTIVHSGRCCSTVTDGARLPTYERL